MTVAITFSPMRLATGRICGWFAFHNIAGRNDGYGGATPLQAVCNCLKSLEQK